MLFWILLQGVLSLTDVYKSLDRLPALPIIGFPGMFFLIYLFNSKRGKVFLDSIDQKTFLWVHVVRIPVELVLYFIFCIFGAFYTQINDI